MRVGDLLRLTLGSLRGQPLRSGLTGLGIAIGITSVTLLTAIGAGVHRFVLEEFTQFGTRLVAINPGKATTFGTSIGVFGSARPLSLDDAAALARLPQVEAMVPVVSGNAEVRGNGRTRRSLVQGVGPQLPQALRLQVASGRFLPDDDLKAPRPYAVLGATLKHELFGNLPALGERIRVGGHRYRVLGVMEPKGQMLGIDLDDAVYIPAARALELFNREGLIEIDLLYSEGHSEDELVAAARRLLSARHGRDDITITTQQQMLDVLGELLDVLTLGVGLLGGISLTVGGVGILTIMTIAVRERTNEIGLLRALGATHGEVRRLFLAEAALLSALGGLTGLLLGLSLIGLIAWLLPALPVQPAPTYIGLSLLLSLLIGLVAGVVPAQRAAALPPVAALRAE